jgi:hypothetical protein
MSPEQRSKLLIEAARATADDDGEALPAAQKDEEAGSRTGGIPKGLALRLDLRAATAEEQNIGDPVFY